jgi:LysR family transcriptional regulator, glycine cleavage system transcriptional activator
VLWTDQLGDHEGQPVPETRLVRVAAPGRGNAAPISWPGIDENAEGALRCPDAGTAIAVARAGMGVATVPLALAEPALADGGVEMVGEPFVGPRHYWLAAPAPQWRQKKVQALVSALIAA